MKTKVVQKLKYLKESQFANYLVILIASIIICIPLFNKNLNIYIDDGIQHICRLIGTYQTIETKEFLPMIMSNFCNNFGYSWNIFYSPITAYAPLLFKIINLSFEQCLKAFLFAITVLSGIAMYKFTLKVTKNRNIATLSAVIYVLAPYRITDMYIRTAIAELASFVFIPIVFNGLYTIINEEKKSYMLAWGAIGLILTHTVVTIYTAILCFIYIMVFIKKLKNKQIIFSLIKNLLFSIVATSFFWVGLLEHYLTTSYEVFVPGRMERVEILKYYKVEFYQLFYTTKEQTMVYALGLIAVVGLIITPIAYKKIPKEYRKIAMLFLAIGLVLTLMTLTFFPFENLPGILTMIQFTFRLFEFTSFLFAFVTAINFGIVIENFKLRDVLIISLVTSLLLIQYINKLDFEKNYDEKMFITPIALTQNTGRVHAGMASLEYLPSKAYNNKEYLINRKDEPIILNNVTANISGYTKNGTNLEFEISNVTQNTVIELPYIYYLGYRICSNGSEISYAESENGFVQISVINDAKITVKYRGTNSMELSTVISLGAILLNICYEIYLKIKNKKQNINKITTE